NQTAIYQALADYVKNKKVDLVVAEGCEGEINAEFKESFNGWDYESLKGQAQRKGYERIITMVPLKIEARFGDKIKTLCGDNEKQIQEGNLRLSNMQGWMGFWTRIREDKDDAERLKLYTDSAAELLHVSKDTPVEKMLPKIKDHLKEELDLFLKSLSARN